MAITVNPSLADNFSSVLLSNMFNMLSLCHVTLKRTAVLSQLKRKGVSLVIPLPNEKTIVYSAQSSLKKRLLYRLTTWHRSQVQTLGPDSVVANTAKKN